MFCINTRCVKSSNFLKILTEVIFYITNSQHSVKHMFVMFREWNEIVIHEIDLNRVNHDEHIWTDNNALDMISLYILKSCVK